ncbi:MAG: chemotaxis protein CheW, partial [Cyclobacteriaceae bacterium]
RLVSRFGDLITLDGEQVPFCYLRQALNFDSEAPFHEEVIVVSYEDKKVGLTVDQIVGEYQAVLKPLGRYYQKQDYISGATILGDGTIALVLDTNKTIRELYHHQKQELHKLP